jgi:hypothetical protein
MAEFSTLMLERNPPYKLPVPPLAGKSRKKGSGRGENNPAVIITKNHVHSARSFVVRDGMKNKFWEDTWLGDAPLASQYPNLYTITRSKMC